MFDDRVYEPDPEKPGYLRYVRQHTVGELNAAVHQALTAAGLAEDLDYLGPMPDAEDEAILKETRWLVAFAVEGGSEGHYIHVEAIVQGDKRQLLLLGKTFCGLEKAIAITAEITRVLWSWESQYRFDKEEQHAAD